MEADKYHKLLDSMMGTAAASAVPATGKNDDPLTSLTQKINAKLNAAAATAAAIDAASYAAAQYAISAATSPKSTSKSAAKSTANGVSKSAAKSTPEWVKKTVSATQGTGDQEKNRAHWENQTAREAAASQVKGSGSVSGAVKNILGSGANRWLGEMEQAAATITKPLADVIYENTIPDGYLQQAQIDLYNLQRERDDIAGAVPNDNPYIQSLDAAIAGLQEQIAYLSDTERWEADQARNKAEGDAEVEAMIDARYAKGQAQLAEEMQNRGWIGQQLVSLGSNAVTMGLDTASAALLGINPKIPLGIRSFGEGIQEGKEKGYSVGEQIATGLSRAAVEVGSEMLFGGSFFYDKAGNVSDKALALVPKLIYKVTGNKKLVNFLNSRGMRFLSEGVEEIAATIGNWAVDTVRHLFNNDIEPDDVTLEGLANDFVGGYLMALLGGGAEIGKNAVNSYMIQSAYGDSYADIARAVARETAEADPNSGVPIPADVAENYRAILPTATDEEYAEHYQGYLQETGNAAGNENSRWTNSSGSDIIELLPEDKAQREPDIDIGRSLGAKAKDILVMLPDGSVTTLTEGTRITNVQTIAGKDRNRQIDVIDILMSEYPDTDIYSWQKKKGIGFVDYHGESFQVELHWYEEPMVGRVRFKVKPDAGGNWFYYED